MAQLDQDQHLAGRRIAPGWDDSEAAAQRAFRNFRIIREVGRGGMGIVYEAHQAALGRHVALKVLPLATALDPARLAAVPARGPGRRLAAASADRAGLRRGDRRRRPLFRHAVHRRGKPRRADRRAARRSNERTRRAAEAAADAKAPSRPIRTRSLWRPGRPAVIGAVRTRSPRPR